MAGFKLVYQATKGEFDTAMREIYRPIAAAGSDAMRATGDAVKAQGRAQIAAAGFKRPYQTAWRVDHYPKRGDSANAAFLAYHRVEFSEVFELGERIRGKPLMWVPIPDKRTRVGRKQLRLKDFIARGERLVRVNRPGKAPLLFGRPLSGMKKGRNKAERALYQRYQAGGLVPLFIGVDAVDIDKRLNIYPMIAAEVEKIASRYFDALDED